MDMSLIVPIMVVVKKDGSFSRLYLATLHATCPIIIVLESNVLNGDGVWLIGKC